MKLIITSLFLSGCLTLNKEPLLTPTEEYKCVCPDAVILDCPIPDGRRTPSELY